MKWQEVIGGLALSAAAASCLVISWPAAAQNSPPAIAVLRVTGAEAAARVDRIFRQALREGGHEDGRSIRLLQYSAEGEVGRLPTVAALIVTDRPAVVVAMGPAAARAIKEATSSIPIVALTSSPVELGLASSLARPGGNLTGVSLVTTDLDAKRLSLLSEFVPATRRVAILVDPAVASPEHMALVEAAARQLGITPDLVQAPRPRDIEPALRSARERGAEAVNVLASPMLNGAAHDVAQHARGLGLASMCQWREMAEAGCLLSYGPSFIDSYRLIVAQIDRVLGGALPSEVPILQPTGFELVVNAKTARELGLEIPSSFLARADEVIE